MDRREPADVGIGGDEPAAIFHLRREGERLAAAAGAEIDHGVARPRAGEDRRKLGAFVLDLDQPVDEGGLGLDRRAFRFRRERDAQPDGRPRRRIRVEMGERRGGGGAIALERVDAQVDRRPAGERRALRGAVLAEHGGELGIEPFRVVAAHMGGRLAQARRAERLDLHFGRRRRREASAIGKPADGVRPHAALELEGAEQDRARRRLVHQPGRRLTPPQRIEHEAADGGAVAGAGEAVRQPPILEGIRRRTAARLDIGEHIDRGRKTGSRRHYKASSMRTAKPSHMNASTTSPAANAP